MAEPQLEAAAVVARATTINALFAGIVHACAAATGAARSLVIGVTEPRAAATLAGKRALVFLRATHCLSRCLCAMRSDVRPLKHSNDLGCDTWTPTETSSKHPSACSNDACTTLKRDEHSLKTAPRVDRG